MRQPITAGEKSVGSRAQLESAATIASWCVDLSQRPDRAFVVEPRAVLGEYPPRLTDCLDFWAKEAPGRTFLAQRSQTRAWRRIDYAGFRRRALAVARWLVRAGFDRERPVAILSGNDLEHAILAFGSMYAGIPYAPISPAYSLVSSDLKRLRQCFDLLTPGLVFASDGALFGRAIESVVAPGTVLVVTRNPPRTRPAGDFEEISAVDAEFAEPELPVVPADCLAKVLFTSGSTGVPKGVITTHRMLSSNQQMLRTVFPFLADEPPTICDWLPWNHTFGGSHNLGLALYNGGTMYIDGGRPMNGEFEETAANLREIAPTAHFNVPKGYEMLAAVLRHDQDLRDRFFSRLRMMFYAAAGLSQQTWDELERMALETRGCRVPMVTGLGATETAPFAMCASTENRRAGVVGLPVPGVRLKLAPAGGKLEARIQGPNVTPGYWRQPELTRRAFDEDGYYRMGDGLRFADPADANRGFLYDGRLSEDFKLSTGTWVSVGPLRIDFLLHFAPYVRDVVIAGHDRDEVTALIFPDTEQYQRLQLGGRASETLERLLQTFAIASTGSSTRIERAIVLQDPPSLDAGELTDKGTVNQRAVLERRAAMVDRLYAFPLVNEIISAMPRKARAAD